MITCFKCGKFLSLPTARHECLGRASSQPEYLGDSVYGQLGEDGMLCLTTQNGLGPSNTIYLEKEVFHALVSFAKRMRFTTDSELSNV